MPSVEPSENGGNNPLDPLFETDVQYIEATAVAMRRQADAALDGVEDYAGIPPHWAYAMLALAGFMETEVKNLNLRTRAFSTAAARAFWSQVEGI